MRTIVDLSNELKTINFFDDSIHPEYLPFIGDDYLKYRVLHVGESHYIRNYPNVDEIIVSDFDGWWQGKETEKIKKLKEWYNTRQVVSDYMYKERHKGHSIFTNTLRSFCNIVIPGEEFSSISDENSAKYNYFAFMNFYQMPSIYFGMSFTKALYKSAEVLYQDNKEVPNKIWYDCMEHSARIFERVVEILDPKLIIITSSEIKKYYKAYGKKEGDGKYVEGNLFYDPRIIYVDHPGSSWWNRVKKNCGKTSKEILEDRLREIYKK